MDKAFWFTAVCCDLGRSMPRLSEARFAGEVVSFGSKALRLVDVGRRKHCWSAMDWPESPSVVVLCVVTIVPESVWAPSSHLLLLHHD